MVHNIEYFISQQIKHSVIAQFKEASKATSLLLEIHLETWSWSDELMNETGEIGPNFASFYIRLPGQNLLHHKNLKNLSHTCDTWPTYLLAAATDFSQKLLFCLPSPLVLSTSTNK